MSFLVQTGSRCASPHPPCSSGSDWTSRRSSWCSLSRGPSYKHQKRQSGEKRSLLSGEGSSSSDDEGAGEGGFEMTEKEDAALARTDSVSQMQRGSRHQRMESTETRSSMDFPTDALLQVNILPHWLTKALMKTEMTITCTLHPYLTEQVPHLCRTASTNSCRPPSLNRLQLPEHSDCNGKGSASVPDTTNPSVEENTEDNAEEDASPVSF